MTNLITNITIAARVSVAAKWFPGHKVVPLRNARSDAGLGFLTCGCSLRHRSIFHKALRIERGDFCALNRRIVA